MILRLTVLLLALIALPAQAAPDIQHWTTDNGLRVYYVEAPELPMVDLRLVFDAGSARDGGRPGLARMTNALLASGAGDWDADAIAERFESVGAQYGAGAARDMAWVSLRSLNDLDWFEPALATFLAVVQAPRFPAADFERTRRQAFVALSRQAQDPGEIASKALYEAVYGDHPYAHPPLGTRESIEGLARGDLAAFHARHYVARNGVLAIVGDLDRPAAEALADRVSAGLAASEPAPALPPVPTLDEARTLRIPFPSEQAHVYLGAPGMSRGDADYFALYFGNHMLGGSGFTSRLTKAVRVERGLSYSVYSYFLPMAQQGPFLAGLQTRVDQAEEAVEVARETLATFVAQGPAAEEYRASLANITGGFPLRVASNSDIVQYLAMIGFYDLPLDYLDRFTDRIEAVTVADIRDAFARRLDPERMITVIVGGPEAE